MKILFGIQGTGNGHISRSKELIKCLSTRFEVDVLISGNQHEVDIGLEIGYRYDGLGFTFGKRGGIDYRESIIKASPYKLIRDIIALPVKNYDLVISDFEPITSWASKLRGIPCIAISHQASFVSSKIPRPRHRNYFQELILKWYAPSATAIGVHFLEYDDFIFQPIIREEIRNTEVEQNGHYTVYLPSYDQEFLSSKLRNIDVKWEVFSKHHKGVPYTDDNVTVFPIGNDEFVKSLCSCEGILCNAGFETPSEALHLGKKLMVIPMKRQYEQECNAEALKRLGISVLYDINDDFEHSVTEWISSQSVYSPECANTLPIIVHKIDEFVSSRL